MSLAGFLRHRGSRLTVRRSTQVKRPNGTYNSTWADIIVNCPGALKPVTPELAQKLWGQETKATYSCLVESRVPVAMRDGVIVTAKHYAGLHFRVAAVSPHLVGSGSDHQALGLELTTEVFA